MPTSEYISNLKKVGQVIFVVILTTVMLVWLNQNSLDNFWQQKYHRNSPWTFLKGEPLWDLGHNVQQGSTAAGEIFMAYAKGTYQDNPVHAMQIQSMQAQDTNNDNSRMVFHPGFQIGLRFLEGYVHPIENLSVTFPELLQKDIKLAQAPSYQNDLIQSTHIDVIQKTHINLGTKDKVLFVGDSMMQGVAPLLKRRLSQEYGISSINLSKQSTGLSYPSFFDWPKTISNTLKTHTDIKLIVVFLGPNDPWDMPAKRGGPYLKFSSDGWETVYRQRIETILQEARQNQVDVIWVGPPNMRKKKLSSSMAYLNKLYETEVARMGEIYVSVNDMFKYQSDNYSDYIGDGSSTIKLRSGDGIHFSLKGQQTISNHLFSLIQFIQEPVKEDATI
ncbi:periplasmic protein [Xenorhabdus mauleonii]|uniref:Periplasmic protein n=1 Tax=Xenorhabdus mauleonii TaxID=351675 RepID=A0A1I3KBX6_9GAMM|nr:SGNH family hydrolase [Xenorhabdus mauleonii]PHM44999.1 periplasmic protein [Xenorhabdus mauleonii]SFI69798.1 hypothetical protein SAMN05421680_10333 [Xenorhabdus mauleonii]